MIKQQIFRPISWLPTVMTNNEGMLASDEEQKKSLKKAIDKPWVLDDELLSRVAKMYSERNEILDASEKQILKWEGESYTPWEHKLLIKCKEQITELKNNSKEILELVKHFEPWTINKIMSMSDEELGLIAALALGNK